MRIGIDASRAFIRDRTGIEEYSFQVIKNIREYLVSDSVVLYLKPGQRASFSLPHNWSISVIKWPIFWTQLGLSYELWRHKVDVLFVPSHVVPFIHPKRSLVTIHGLEYEFCPKAYSFWERVYMRWSVRKSIEWAERIIAVSENTKKDLADLHGVPIGKINTIYEGFMSVDKIDKMSPEQNKNNFLFVGRLEQRKNILGILKAFEILKGRFHVPHKLVLAGKSGYGFEAIDEYIRQSPWKEDIEVTGYINADKKKELLQKAGVFVFPTLYEGFGLPVIDAQSYGVPVVTSDGSALREIAGEGAILVDPNDPNEIAQAIFRLISDQDLKNGIIEKGYENLERFSWEKCAMEIAKMIKST